MPELEKSITRINDGIAASLRRLIGDCATAITLCSKIDDPGFDHEKAHQIWCNRIQELAHLLQRIEEHT